MPENLIVETRERVGVLRINRPQRMNALNDALAREICEALFANDADTAIGCNVIVGSEKAFAAGADIGAMAEWDYAKVYADDYITKPFSIREFRSRVRALLRRAATPHHASRRDELVDRGDVVIDLPRRTVEVRGEPVQLTFVEFELLALLASDPGIVFTRRQLLERIRGSADYREPRTIDVHVRHLREKIERDAREPELILTVRGAGYRFRDS